MKITGLQAIVAKVKAYCAGDRKQIKEIELCDLVIWIEWAYYGISEI